MLNFIKVILKIKTTIMKKYFSIQVLFIVTSLVSHSAGSA